MNKRSKNLGLILPTAAEDAAIAAGIAQDADTMEITADDMARMQPLRRPGRPKVEQPKVPVTMRVAGRHQGQRHWLADPRECRAARGRAPGQAGGVR
jgi:hypothetical protein